MKTKSSVLIGILVLALSATAYGDATRVNYPDIVVRDQEMKNMAAANNGMLNFLTVEAVISDGPGWIAISTSQVESADTIIGYALLKDGMNKEVNVQVNFTKKVSAPIQLYVLLHTDGARKSVAASFGPDLTLAMTGAGIFSESSGITASFLLLPSMSESGLK
jgi:hypothetical protein